MKKCDYCAEEIQDDAVKCRYCGESLFKKEHGRWYFKTYFLIIAFLCVGPFMLPLAWLNPNFSRNKKIVISLVIIAVSYCLWILFANAMKTMKTYYQLMF